MMSHNDPADVLKAAFVDQSGEELPPLKPWPPLVVPRAAIEGEVARLAGLPRPRNGQRASAVVHPCYAGVGSGISHGYDAVINVLKPGEETAPIRKNSNRVEFCIRGAGIASVNGEDVPLGMWDFCNVPSMQRYAHRNVGKDLFVWLSFSNAPLLETLGSHFSENDPPVHRLAEPHPRKLLEGAFNVELPGGARLQSMEYLSDIEVVQSRALRWAWSDVRNRLPFAPDTNKRDIILLYNPATERRAGTSASFFVTVLGGTVTTPIQPPVRWGHRHTSATLLYQMMGSSIADIEGTKLEWDEGDLIMAAPSWARHSINAGLKHGLPGDWCLFGLQDHPPHIAQESLIWQDNPEQPIQALGLEEEINYLAFSAKLRSEQDVAARKG